MKVVFFGTPQFAVPFLLSLVHSDGINVEAVVTQPDKPVGRKQELTEPPVKVEAMKFGLPVLQPDSLKNNDAFAKLLEGLQADFFAVVAYGMIFPSEYLAIPKIASINVHASLLPKYRGASPIQTALLNGDKETGLTIMHMGEKLDTGDIYLLKKVGIVDKDDYPQLSSKLADIGAVILPSALRDIKSGLLSRLKQDDSKASYCTKISKKDAKVDAERETAEEIMNKLRAFKEWPGIYTEFKGKRLKILNAKVSDEEVKAGKFKASNSVLWLGTKSRSLEISEVQLEGKNPSSAKEFINGFMK